MPNKAALDVLTYSVRGRVILKYTAQLTLVQALLLPAPLLVSLCYGEYTIGCGFVHGDGSKPAILKETDPAHIDFLFCLTGND